MADAFISYAKGDRPLAVKLAAMLEAEGDHTSATGCYSLCAAGATRLGLANAPGVSPRSHNAQQLGALD